MERAIVFDPAGVATLRTSIERVLGRVPSLPFTTATEFPAYWREAVALHGSDDLALRIASELPVGAFARTPQARLRPPGEPGAVATRMPTGGSTRGPR
ncbi:MAG TPA: hypothetical protein VIV40_18440, partial [Kofleriaceae bacterium]